MQSIEILEGSKLYYPYLRDKYDNHFPIEHQFDDILAYLLLVDKVILPPSHVFSNEILKKNNNFLERNRLFQSLIANQKILITAVSQDFRDIFDVIEYYSGKKAKCKFYTNKDIFLRDVAKQKQAFCQLVSRKLDLNILLKKDTKSSILSFLDSSPTKSEFDSFISAHKVDFSNDEIKHLINYSQRGYHFGGVIGNDAIMPPETFYEEELFYNNLYERYFARFFKDLIEKKAKRRLSQLKTTHFLNLINNLWLFHSQYQEFSKLYEKICYRVEPLLTGKINIWKNYKQLINATISTIIGSSISFIVAQDFVTALYLGSVISFTINFLLSYSRLIDLLTDVTEKFFKQSNLFDSYERELYFLLNEFNNSSREAMRKFVA